MDAIAPWAPEAVAAVVARHPQVVRIVCGHAHRQVTAGVALATASIAPSVGVAVAFDLDPAGLPVFVKEPPQFVVHLWTAENGFVLHNVFVVDFEGPCPFVTDPEYPGRCWRRRICRGGAQAYSCARGREAAACVDPPILSAWR